MSSSNITPVIVRDEIIQDITTQQPVTMLKGASQNTYTTVPASSSSTSQMDFTTTITGSVVTNRNIKLQSTVDLQITIPANSVDTNSLCALNMVKLMHYQCSLLIY